VLSKLIFQYNLIVVIVFLKLVFTEVSRINYY